MNDPTLPSFAVAMPMRNAAPWIREAISSLLSQTHPPSEILVGDDASEDGGASIAEEMRAPTVRVVRWDSRAGISTVLNGLLDACPTRFVARMDADDVSRPDRFRLQFRHMAARGLGVCGTWARRSGLSTTPHHTPVAHADILAESGFLAPFVHPTVAFDRDRIAACGAELRYDPAEDLAEDYGLWRRILRVVPSGNVPAELLDWRLHGGNAGVSDDTRPVQHAKAAAIRRRCWDDAGFHPEGERAKALEEHLACRAPDPSGLGALAAAFGAILALDRERLWAPRDAMIRNLSARWSHACLVASWGRPRVLGAWFVKGSAAGLRLDPRVGAKIAAKALVPRSGARRSAAEPVR